uniref:Uncharacterized protein HI_0077 n=1 Tax=Rhizophora mucronata TaxID=61149 RepID=A0A2P2KAY6_RHIMU
MKLPLQTNYTFLTIGIVVFSKRVLLFFYRNGYRRLED